MSKKRQKILWHAFINLGGGLHYDKPIPLIKDEYDDCWYSDFEKHGDYCGDGPGYEFDDGHCHYSSFDKKEVELFILGAKSLIDCCLSNILNPGKLPK